MPQLNTQPWFTALLSSWMCLLTFILAKVQSFLMPGQNKEKDPGATGRKRWPWPWP